jgi:hypothetical protein
MLQRCFDLQTSAGLKKTSKVFALSSYYYLVNLWLRVVGDHRMLKRTFALSFVALLVTSTAGCGTNPQATSAGRNMAASSVQANGHFFKGGAKPTIGAPAAGAEAAFVSAVKSQGITLTPDQLAQIQAERAVKPNMTWAPRPAVNLTAAQNLTVHFLKHGHEFNPALASEQAYMAQGNAAGTGGRGVVRFYFDTTSYTKGYQTHVVRWVPSTNDFTAFRTDGAETTYYQSQPQPGRFIEVPAW